MRPLLTWPLWRKMLTVFLATIGMIAAGAGSWAGYLRVTGNIHEVEAGKVYRSGQLSPSQLASLLREKRIRTVLNLRGEKPGHSWYDEEIQVTRKAGARHISLPMSANVEPNEALLTSLIEALASSEQPILIHCEGGADRSGLASALYAFLKGGKSADEANGHLSFRYGHFPWLTSRTEAMDRTFWRVVSDWGRRPAAALKTPLSSGPKSNNEGDALSSFGGIIALVLFPPANKVNRIENASPPGLITPIGAGRPAPLQP
jgi:protein tyrosine phosphatase (PTP) superfamily phosphohydrolase (DUF442 family)